MANSKKFVVKNGLETQNIQFVEQDGTQTITLTVLDDGSLSFSGSSGQLFSIVDSLTGSIFSVNDISGIPSIEVFDDGKVILAESTGNVGIGILTPTEKLTVSGNVSATRLISTQATGTAPLTVASTTKVDNLNADLLDGNDSTAFATSTHVHGNISNGGEITSTVVGPANNDTILISDVTASGKIERGITIGTGTTTYLRNDGQWGTPAGTGPTGSGTTNEIAYWSGTSTIGSLTTATYPSLTELSYVKGVTSAIQTQLNDTVKTTGDQSIAGTKTFTGNVNISGILDLTNTNVTGALDLSNNNIVGVNNVEITDPGPNEGISWAGGNLWRIWESPNDLTTNGGGNLQIVQNATRRATFNTSGQLEIPVATGTAPLTVASTTKVDNLNADMVDGFHAASLSKRVNLTGQVQTTDYRKSVIALCELTNSNPSANSYSIGMITFHRTNGLTAPALMQIAMEKRYNVVGANYTSFVQSGDSFGDNIQYIKFQYNGVWYGGIEFFFSDATLSEVTFHGESNFAIFGLDYFNTQTSTPINTEINSSITTTDMNAENDLFINNNKVWNAQNDGSGSGLDADLLDGLNSDYFLNTSGTTQTKSGSLNIGSTGTDYTGNNGANHNIFLNGSTHSSIGFHDSGDTIGHIRFSNASGFEIGRADGTYGPHNTSLWGRVGIGTSFSPSYRLNVSGNAFFDGGIAAHFFQDASNGDYFVDPLGNVNGHSAILNGRVGIGTLSPSTNLDVVSSSTPVVEVETTATTGNQYAAYRIKTPTKSYDIGVGINSETTYGIANDLYIFDGTATAVRAVIDTNGNVGIGTTSPSAKLEVANVAANIKAIVVGRASGQPSIAANSENGGYMIIDSKDNFLSLNHYVAQNIVLGNGGGSVGIGTSSPSARLDVVSSSFPALNVERTVSLGNLVYGTDRNLLTSSVDMVDGFGPVTTYAIEDNAAVINPIADIGALRSGADNSGRIIFRTYNAGTVGEKMTIMPDGKVGIGTSAPAYQLDVIGDFKVYQGGNTALKTYSAVAGGVFVSYLSDQTVFTKTLDIVANADGTAPSRMRFFAKENTTSSPLERMRIEGNGLVGINETSPTAQLQVKSGATTRVPLIVDTVASHTARLQDWLINGSLRATITNAGAFDTPLGIRNISDSNNSRILTETTGAKIDRNVADTNPALITNIANSGSTANIQVWQFTGNAVANINRFGSLRALSLDNLSSSDNSRVFMDNNGTTISRNIADANPTLIINQIHASSTGDVLKVQAGGTDRLTVKQDGKVGIGTTSPGESLSVEGDAYVRDKLRVGLISSGNDSIYLENSVTSVDGAGGLYHNSGDQTIAAFRQSPNEYIYASGNLKFVESTDTFEVNGNLTVNGNIVNTGSTITVNTTNLTVTDKNIELGYITPKTGLVATLSTGTANITLTTGTTEGMIPGQALTKTGGTGVFGTNARIATITGLTTLTATVNHATAGSITFTASGATDFTADGGGITLKGTNDHKLEWNKNLLGAGAWSFPNERLYLLNEETSGDKLVIEDTDAEEGSVVRISSTSTLPNDIGISLLSLNYQATTGAAEAYVYGVNADISPTPSSGNASVAIAGRFSASSAIQNFGVDAQAQALTSGNTAYGLNAYASGVSGSTIVAINAGVDGAGTSKYTFRGAGGTLYNEGSVGIGTDAPLNKLDIRITGADSNDGIMVSRADTTTTTNEILGGIGFDSTDGNVPSSVLEASAYIAAFAAEDHSTGDKGGYLTFGTAPIDQDDDTVSSERMRIEAGGNVGIGVTTTNAQLDVKDTFHITNSANTSHGIMIENRSTYFNSTGKAGIWSSAGVIGGDFSGLGANLIIEGRKNADRHIYIKVGDTTTATHIFKADASVGINTIAPTAKLDVNGDLKHTGLTMTTGTNVDQTKETTFTSALTTAWTDVTGVSGTYLATGSYIVQIISNGEYYTGEMSWFSGTTTSTTADEIVLHRAGPAASAGRIYARVIRTSSAPSTLKLQVSASTSVSSHTMTFKFRRTI